MPILDEILKRQLGRKQNTTGEILRAIGMGIGGRASEYKPLDTQGSDMEKLITTELVKRQLDQQDPYRQSQTALNQAMLNNINGSGNAGGDLVYRDQLTGIEVPAEQAIPKIQQGEQFIIKRRVATRQGIKEEDVSKPKELTEGEVKTSTGAEEVLKEIEDLKNIISNEPQNMGASIPYFGKSAQAQGVTIPFLAPSGVSQKGQEYRTLRESINNRLLYLRSGAQINDKEYQRLSKMLPELFRSDKVDLQQLERFKNEFSGILQRIRTGRRGIPYSGMLPNQPNQQQNNSQQSDPLGLR